MVRPRESNPLPPAPKADALPTELSRRSRSNIFKICLIALKETRSATMNIFRKKYFLFKSFVKIELSYVITINMFSIAENCKEK